MWGQPLGSAPNTGVIVYTVGATFEPGRVPQWAVQYCEYIVLLQTFLCGDSSTMPPPPVLCTQLLWEVIFCCQIFEIIFHYFDWSPLRPGAWNWILSVSIMPGGPLPPLADISFEPRVPAPQHPAPRWLHTIRCLGRTPADNDDSIDCEYHYKEADLGVYLNQSRYPPA